jgi:hypothetical protein
MSFTNYAGTPFAPWLLPIIPCDATLTGGSKITPENLGKIPGMKYQSGWSGFAGWTGITVKETVLVIWDSWYPKDECTIGLQGRLFPCIDADVNEAWQAQVIRDVAFQVFGETIVRGRSDGSPRQLLMYRLEQAPDFIHKFVREYGGPCPNFKVEILGAGQQYLIEGKHPKGGTYVWDKSPTEHGCENIPRISPAKLVEFIHELDEAFALVKVFPQRPKQLRTGDSGGGPGAQLIGPDHPEVAPSLDELKKVLGFLSVTDNDFQDYDDWERVCRAIKTACGGSEEFCDEVYLPWQLDGDNEPDYVRQKWESHTDSKIGFDYLANIAAQHGYGPSSDGLFEALDDSAVPADEPGTALEPPRYRGPVPKPMPEGFTLHEIPRRPFVLGHRFMAGTVTLGVGAPGAGKSNLAILTALAIATGQPLTGEEVHRTGPVWIHNNEDSLDELHRRIGGMLQSLGINYEQVHKNILVSSGLDERLIVAFKSKDIVKRTEAVADVIAAIKEQGIVHMVIDPLVSTHLGVSENSNEEIEQVMGTIQHIAHETGGSIDLVHHSLKSHSQNTEVYAGDMNAARGASSLIGAARMVYTLAPMSEKTREKWKLSAAQAARLVRLDHGKGNYAARDTDIRWFELETFEIGNGDPFGTDGPPVPSDTIAVPKPWNPPAKQLETSKAVEHVGKLQQVRDVVAGAMSLDRCKLTDLLPAIGQAFNLKSSAARALLMDAIPEAGEVTAEVAEQTYLLKLDRVKPVPPGRLWVVRRRLFDQEAEAA